MTVEIEGPDEAIEQFLQTLRSNPPPLAQIMEIALENVSMHNASQFSIQPSREQENAFAFISPDMATCDNCWREFGDLENRHCARRRSAICDGRHQGGQSR